MIKANEIILIVLGRIHSAVVSGVNAEAHSVTVEWFEKGETKGKEVKNLVRLKKTCWNLSCLFLKCSLCHVCAIRPRRHTALYHVSCIMDDEA